MPLLFAAGRTHLDLCVSMNSRLFIRFVVAVAFHLGLANAALPPGVLSKKGVGLSERRGLGAAQVEALNVGWYYNWSAETALRTNAQFVPMIFSAKRMNAAVKGDTVLGFNEPDHEKQSNIPVKEALALWPRVVSKARYVGSPSTAGNPVTSEWFAAFMKGRPKVDFITVHWYKGADARHFIRDLTEIHAKFNKPIWVTEFAPQTAASSESEPGKFSEAQVAEFIAETVRFMDSTPWVQRYAWHDSRAGTSALFAENGELTATGRAYAAAGRQVKQ
jgi:hypothetical protein